MDTEKNDLEILTEKVEELEELIKENHRMTKTLYRRSMYSAIFSFARWAIVIGIAIGSLYFIQPYLEKVMDMYSTLANFGGGGKAATSTNEFMNLINSWR